MTVTPDRHRHGNRRREPAAAQRRRGRRPRRTDGAPGSPFREHLARPCRPLYFARHSANTGFRQCRKNFSARSRHPPRVLASFADTSTVRDAPLVFNASSTPPASPGSARHVSDHLTTRRILSRSTAAPSKPRARGRHPQVDGDERVREVVGTRRRGPVFSSARFSAVRRRRPFPRSCPFSSSGLGAPRLYSSLANRICL